MSTGALGFTRRRNIRSGSKSRGGVIRTNADAATSSYVFFLAKSRSPALTSCMGLGLTPGGNALFSLGSYSHHVIEPSFSTLHSLPLIFRSRHTGLDPLAIFDNNSCRGKLGHGLSLATG